MWHKVKGRIIVWIIGIIIMLVSLWPLEEKIRQGLDLRGGDVFSDRGGQE